jgi:hypothetical protein
VYLLHLGRRETEFVGLFNLNLPLFQQLQRLSVEVFLDLETIGTPAAIHGRKKRCPTSSTRVNDYFAGIGENLYQPLEQFHRLLCRVNLRGVGVLLPVDAVENHLAAVVELGELVAVQEQPVRGDTEQMVLCQQSDSTYSGQIYAIGSDGTAISITPFGLADIPAGARLDVINPGDGARHVDYCYDIFTSERSLHYYVVKFVSDTAVEHNVYSGNPYPGDLRLYSGGNLVVEKRLKSDLSLVATYNLTPSTVDHQLQDVPTLVQIWNTANGDISGATTGTDIITRFVPYATGMVLVDAAGNEYPILPVLSCSQDWFWDSTAGVTSRENYIATGTVAPDMKRNIFQQPALLWVGTPPDGFDGFTWPDVDAAGLKITAADAGLTNDVGIGGMRIWSSIIGDSDNILAQLLPYTGSDPGASTEQRIISVNLSGGLPAATLKKVLNISQPVSMSDI